ncbi:CBM21 domain-containing protein [Paenibacillus oenotherae]|uniref:CBM21 domain-containing protein n=1 Tax=Paenibacillus oenotherae TaxID=1435645 RepID=A0ABS7CZU7_9BACL|nr:carbohydrate-binding protein [Paenibacillus oenotherae]MBW7473149.1 CBM21 domain-containing protein [Paenibacillus oenotherae]
MMRRMGKLAMGLFVVVMLMGTLAQSAFASGEVALLKAYVYKYKFGYVGFSGDIEVLNSAYAKTVTVHYNPGNGTWYDTNASYVGPTDASHEKWSFSIATDNINNAHPELSGLTSIEFAVKYEVNGQTYWDNNGGSNYTLGTSSSGPGYTLLGKPNVLAQYGFINGTSFYGNVTVKDLAYTKTVKIVYTTNNWVTTQEGYATYSGEANGAGSVENWGFDFNVGSGVTQIKYAVSYTVNGQTYWDNNYGNNYTVTP